MYWFQLRAVTRGWFFCTNDVTGGAADVKGDGNLRNNKKHQKSKRKQKCFGWNVILVSSVYARCIRTRAFSLTPSEINEALLFISCRRSLRPVPSDSGSAVWLCTLIFSGLYWDRCRGSGSQQTDIVQSRTLNTQPIEKPIVELLAGTACVVGDLIWNFMILPHLTCTCSRFDPPQQSNRVWFKFNSDKKSYGNECLRYSCSCIL